MFHTAEFIFGFIPACVTVYFIIARCYDVRWALGWLVACNLFFYGWWNPAHLPLLATSVIGNYVIAWKLQQAAAPRMWLAAGIGANLILLAWFKYADFLLHSIAPALPPLAVTLPLAISFFTFQQIMFLVDTADACTGTNRRTRQETPPAPPSLLTYAAFVTFFPHLIAGPIVRPNEIIPQITTPAVTRPHRGNLTEGLLIFLLGLGKKLVLADMFGGFADIGFNAAGQGAALTFFEAWYAALSYALQIYFDFSGYSGIMYQAPQCLLLWKIKRLTRFPAWGQYRLRGDDMREVVM